MSKIVEIYKNKYLLHIFRLQKLTLKSKDIKLQENCSIKQVSTSKQ